MDKRHAVVETVLGEITLVAHGDALVGIYFRHHWYPPGEDDLGEYVTPASDQLLHLAQTQLGEYLTGSRTRFELSTTTHGDSFQEQVWSLLRDVPYGETTTYGALAQQLGWPATARAVGGAVGRNPLSVLVPCHRVVGANGKLTGYAGGLRRKQFLLDLEENQTGGGKLFDLAHVG